MSLLITTDKKKKPPVPSAPQLRTPSEIKPVKPLTPLKPTAPKKPARPATPEKPLKPAVTIGQPQVPLGRQAAAVQPAAPIQQGAPMMTPTYSSTRLYTDPETNRLRFWGSFHPDNPKEFHYGESALALLMQTIDMEYQQFLSKRNTDPRQATQQQQMEFQQSVPHLIGMYRQLEEEQKAARPAPAPAAPAPAAPVAAAPVVPAPVVPAPVVPAPVVPAPAAPTVDAATVAAETALDLPAQPAGRMLNADEEDAAALGLDYESGQYQQFLDWFRPREQMLASQDYDMTEVAQMEAQNFLHAVSNLEAEGLTWNDYLDWQVDNPGGTVSAFLMTPELDTAGLEPDAPVLNAGMINQIVDQWREENPKTGAWGRRHDNWLTAFLGELDRINPDGTTEGYSSAQIKIASLHATNTVPDAKKITHGTNQYVAQMLRFFDPLLTVSEAEQEAAYNTLFAEAPEIADAIEEEPAEEPAEEPVADDSGIADGIVDDDVLDLEALLPKEITDAIHAQEGGKILFDEVLEPLLVEMKDMKEPQVAMAKLIDAHGQRMAANRESERARLIAAGYDENDPVWLQRMGDLDRTEAQDRTAVVREAILYAAQRKDQIVAQIMSGLRTALSKEVSDDRLSMEERRLKAQTTTALWKAFGPALSKLGYEVFDWAIGAITGDGEGGGSGGGGSGGGGSGGGGSGGGGGGGDTTIPGFVATEENNLGFSYMGYDFHDGGDAGVHLVDPDTGEIFDTWSWAQYEEYVEAGTGEGSPVEDDEPTDPISESDYMGMDEDGYTYYQHPSTGQWYECDAYYPHDCYEREGPPPYQLF